MRAPKRVLRQLTACAGGTLPLTRLKCSEYIRDTGAHPISAASAIRPPSLGSLHSEQPLPPPNASSFHIVRISLTFPTDRDRIASGLARPPQASAAGPQNRGSS